MASITKRGYEITENLFSGEQVIALYSQFYKPKGNNKKESI